MDEQLHERVREIIATVPPGKVTTYGDIAAFAGARSPRLVGRILAEDGADLPWHRVLRADGTPAPHLAHQQLELLRSEGVLADGRKVDHCRVPRCAEPRPCRRGAFPWNTATNTS